MITEAEQLHLNRIEAQGGDFYAAAIFLTLSRLEVMRTQMVGRQIEAPAISALVIDVYADLDDGST